MILTLFILVNQLTNLISISQGRRHIGAGKGCWNPTITWSKKKFFFCKTGVDKREVVDEKSNEKWCKEGVQPKKWYASQMFFYVLFLKLDLFFLVSHDTLKILQQATRKTHPRAYKCISDNYTIFAQKY